MCSDGHRTEGMCTPSGETTKAIESKSRYKDLRISETDEIKHDDLEEDR